MAKYILLDALLAEIENLLDKGKYHEEYDCAYRDGNNSALYALKGRINSLEVKEVDLEKELVSWRNNHFHGRRDKEASGEYLERVSQLDLAKHFFELGLKAEQEPVSDDLNEAAEEWDESLCRSDAFKAGAKWQITKLVEEAGKHEVKVDAGGYPYIPQIELYDYDKDIPLAKEGDKYKVILIKEE